MIENMTEGPGSIIYGVQWKSEDSKYIHFVSVAQLGFDD
jgi:hypothetical protein